MYKNKPYEGIFLTIEGGEGAGKSTLAAALVAHCHKQGYPLVHTREPGGTLLSERVRALLLENEQPSLKISEQAELLLFLAARAQHVEEVMLPALRAGKLLLCERFNDSTIAYQGGARHLGMDYVEQLVHLAIRDLSVDCTLLLDIDPEVAFQRLGRKRDRLESEALQFHREVRSAFLYLADKYSERIVVLDATLPEQELLQAALRALQPHLAAALKNLPSL